MEEFKPTSTLKRKAKEQLLSESTFKKRVIA
jgi:hypothetical protein